MKRSLLVTSSDLPRWDRNLNSAENAMVGTMPRKVVEVVDHDVETRRHWSCQ